MNSYIEFAYKLAAFSTHKRQKMAAVVVRGGAILSAAYNMCSSNQSNNIQKGHKCCERRALRPHLDTRGATIIVVRQNGGMSKPCVLCQRVIQEAGIKKVVYTDWNGEIVINKVSELN